MKGIVMG